MYVGTILSNRYTVVSKTNSLSWNNTGDLTVKKEIDKKKNTNQLVLSAMNKIKPGKEEKVVAEETTQGLVGLSQRNLWRSEVWVATW